MNHYEAVVIIAGSVGEEDLPKIQEEIKGEFDKIKAVMRAKNSLGRRKLAYPIKKQHNGTYFVYNFDAEAETLESFEKAMRLNPQVLRHLVVTEHVLTDEQKVVKTALQAKVRAKRVAEESKAAEEKRVADAPKEEAVSKEQLDKKLDTLLDEDINID